MSLTKQQLQVLNTTNFPNNTTGYITPTLLRDFNSQSVDSMALQTEVTNLSASFQSQLNGLEDFSSSLVTNFATVAQLNTSSSILQSNINGKATTGSVNTLSQSVYVQFGDQATVNSNTITRFNTDELAFNQYTQSNNAAVAGKASLSQDNYFVGNQYVTGKITIDGNISASGDIRAVGNIYGANLTGSFVSSSTFNSFSSSVYQTDATQSTNIGSNSSSIGLLQTFSGSQYKNDSSSFDSRIIAATGSSINTGSFATTGSNTFIGNQTITGDITASGNISSSTISGIGNVTLFSSSVDSRLLAAGGQSQIQEEGTILGNATSFNFIGAGVTATFSAGTASVTIPGGGGTIATGSFATTGSNSFTGSQTINGNIILTGSNAEIQNAKGVGIFNSGYNLDYKLTMPIQNTIGYIDELNLPHYYNGGIQPTISASATINNHHLVKVTPQEWFNLTASVGDNHTGILSVEQSTGWDDINNTFGMHGNFLTSGSINYITQRGLSKVGIFKLGGSPVEPYIGQPVYVSDNGYELQAGYPSGSRVLRYGYVASFEQTDPLNMYVRQIFVDPVWEKGETVTDLNVSSSLRVTGSLNVTGSTNFSELTGSLASFSSSIDSRILAIPTINTGSFAITGSNQFNGNQTITGSLFVSSSNTSDIVVNGQVFISSSTSGSTNQAKLTISGSTAGSTGRAAQVVIVPTSVTLTRATTSGTQTISLNSTNGNISLTGPVATITAAITTGSSTADISAVYAVGAIDNEVHLSADANGIYLQDWDNTALNYSPWLSIGPNDGVTIPPVKFQRAVNFTSGSNQQTGLATLDGGNPGAVTVSNTNVTANSIILITKQTLAHPNGYVAVSSKGSGTFTITSNHNGDADVVGYMIINPST